jgi:glutathione-regulated potassium-efflux system protein KefB
VPAEEAAETIEGVRDRDAERLQLQISGGLTAGRDLTIKNQPQPVPLTKPRREARPLTEETAVVAEGNLDVDETTPD